MDEPLPGVFHWSAFHEGIRERVHSYLAVGPRLLIDPMVPAEGLEWFEGERRPERIALTNRHHHRHSGRFVEAFGCPVLCHEAGLFELEGEAAVEGFAFGDELAPGAIAREVGAICPEETAVHLVNAGAMAIADAVVRDDGGDLSFVPGNLLGDDSERIRRDIRASLRRLCERHDFDALLLAHGEPLPTGGREALRAFAG